MDEREILTRFKAGTLDRGQTVQLLAELETVPGRGPRPVLSPAPDRTPAPNPGPEPSRIPSPVPDRSDVPDSDGVPDTDDRFAVVGIAGRYPFAPDLRVYWQNVREGRDTSSAAPLGRPGASPLGPGQRGHFLDGAADFDPDFFGMTPHRASLLDPQERLFLETVWEALEDAGCTGTRLDALTGPGGAPRGLGVFVGVSAADYALVAAEAWARGGREMPESGHWSLAGRLSGLLGLSGPAQAVDTAESSALVAVHLAVGALRRGECAAAVAGGVELLLHPSRGRQGAGEGVGAVVLKPLACALADGDHVHAVVRSTSTGTSAWTGTPELRETRETTVCRVGHAGAVTGLAALTAAVLQLRYGILAPARGSDTATPWPRPRDARGQELPRTALVEVAGAGGPFDVRAVLEEFVPDRHPRDGHDDAWEDAVERDELILLSAPTPGHLAATAARLADWLASDNGGSGDVGTGDERVTLTDLARSLRAGRAAQPCRIALLADGIPQVVGALREFVNELAGGDVAGAGGAGSGAYERARDSGVRYVDLRTGGADPLGLGQVPETHDYLGALWRGGRVEQLTRLWLSGLDIDWAALESRPGPLVPLPPSAFLRRPLWLGRQEGAEETGKDG
ncbi:beta-ketoacyl synthase N-terminal-like domain-containing protein [Streptomyces sp. NPDC087511]|uniref:beta-ketoacyl [acyl carrier protein] synthase domain-containing protein n=1 Tax=Streptomyces sp. NPDC087511 TaxID=3365792 RepID=UPI0037FD2090